MPYYPLIVAEILDRVIVVLTLFEREQKGLLGMRMCKVRKQSVQCSPASNVAWHLGILCWRGLQNGCVVGGKCGFYSIHILFSCIQCGF